MEEDANGGEGFCTNGSSISSVFHLMTKLTQTKIGNKNNGGKIGDNGKTIYFKTCFS